MKFARPNRALAVVTAAVTIAALAAGCSDPSGQGAGSIPTGPVTLTVQTDPGIATEILANADAEFVTKYPNVKINLKDGEAWAGPNKGRSALEGVDVLLASDNDLPALVKGRLVSDLTAVKLPAADRLVAGVFDEIGRTGGKRYGVPVAFNPSLVLINKRSIQAAGIQPPTADWTWQDLLQGLTAVKAAGIRSEVPLSAIAEPLVRSYGGQIYDPNTEQFTFDTPEAKQALSVLQPFVKGQLVQNDSGGGVRVSIITPTGGAQGGAGGLAPAFVALDGGVYRINGEMQALPYPKGPGGRPGRVTGTIAVVPLGSPNAAMAAVYVKNLLANPAEQLALAKGGVRPVTDDANALAAWRQAVGDSQADAWEMALHDGYFAQPIPHGDALLNGLMPYLEGKVPLEPTISNLVRALN